MLVATLSPHATHLPRSMYGFRVARKCGVTVLTRLTPSQLRARWNQRNMRIYHWARIRVHEGAKKHAFVSHERFLVHVGPRICIGSSFRSYV